MKKFTTILAALALAISMLFASCGKDEGTANITVGTGGTTGTYYAYTNAVGSILQQDGEIAFDVVSTGGSVANINGIDDGDYDMVIVQNDTMINAYNDLDKDNFKNEYDRWPGRTYNNELTSHVNSLKSQEEAADYLYNWLKVRYTYINSVWGDKTVLYTD